jgi:hypothetical protein
MTYAIIGRSIVRVRLINSSSMSLLVKDDEGREFTTSAIYSLDKAVRTLCKPNDWFFVDQNKVYKCIVQYGSYKKDEEGESLELEVWDENDDTSIITAHPDEVHTFPHTIVAAIERYYN